MERSTNPPMLAGLLFMLVLAMPLGCGEGGSEEDVDDEAGTETGEEPPPPKVCKKSCQECEDFMKDAYACMAYDKSFDESVGPLTTFDCIICENEAPPIVAGLCETQAELQGIYFTDMEAQLVPCGDSDGTDGTDGTDGSDDSDDSMQSANCADWLPGRQVHAKRDNEWDIERDFVTALVADPSQLVGCDGARVRRSFGFYRVASLDSDDLLGALGLMNDDVIQRVNGYAMTGPFEAARAFFELWPDTRVFTVSVLRPGVGVLSFTYNVV